MSAEISGCILAGGRGSRLDHADKGLLEISGKPLIAYVIDRLRPQVGDVIISANRNLALYREYSPNVIADSASGYQGPLSGFLTALRTATTPLVAIVPCDCPYFPKNLVTELAQAICRQNADIAVARACGRLQPVFSLLKCSLAPALESFMQNDGRRIAAWYTEHTVAEVDFGDDPDAFANINVPEDLVAARNRQIPT